MNPLRTSLATLTACGLLYCTVSPAFAGTKDYQYTGTITALNDTGFTIMKGSESSDFAKDTDTKLPDGAKVGDKVTVHYVMHATTVEAGKDKAAPKEKAPTKEKAAAPAASPKA